MRRHARRLSLYEGELFARCATRGIRKISSRAAPAGSRLRDAIGRLLVGESVVCTSPTDAIDDRSPRPVRAAAACAPIWGCRCAKTTLLGAISAIARRSAVHRQADRTFAEFRRAGGDRDRECAALNDLRPRRDLSIARIPDRDRRSAAGHQLLALRPRSRFSTRSWRKATRFAMPIVWRSAILRRRVFPRRGDARLSRRPQNVGDHAPATAVPDDRHRASACARRRACRSLPRFL